MGNTAIMVYITLSLAIGYIFTYPLFGEVSGLMADKSKHEESLVMTQNVEQKKNELLKKYNAISEADQKSISRVLPNSFNFITLISQIDAVGSRYGISVDKTTFKEINSSAGDSINKAQSASPYRSAVIGFSFISSYEQFRKFMADLEGSLQILDIRNLKIEAGEKGVNTYSVEFETYWLK